ncbi:MAG: hypothetical protein Kow00114_20120 [Kiloniellaceae bacterium]
MTSSEIFAAGVAALLALGVPAAAAAHGPDFGDDGGMPYGWH